MKAGALVLVSRAERDTERVGERLGRALRGGEFVGLAGALGAGKTAFVRGLARGAGVPEKAGVASPTFAIVNAYGGGRLPLFHADLYRVSDAEELYDAGFYDLGAEGAVAVEWIDRVPEAAPADWLEVHIERAPAGRRLSFFAHGEKAAAALERMRARRLPAAGRARKRSEKGASKGARRPGSGRRRRV